MVTVTVEASWRLARIEFNLPLLTTQMVNGFGEVMLSESTGAGPQAILRRQKLSPLDPVDTKTYGSMPGTMITRPVNEATLAEEIDINGTKVTFGVVMDALNAFFEKWRIEDADKPLGPPPVPQTAALTPVPQLGELGMPPPNVATPLPV